MQISLLLRESAQRFNQASELVCIEWSLEIGSNGICSPSDRNEFNRLVKSKIAASDSESPTTLHTNISEANTYVQSKLSA